MSSEDNYSDDKEFEYDDGFIEEEIPDEVFNLQDEYVPEIKKVQSPIGKSIVQQAVNYSEKDESRQISIDIPEQKHQIKSQRMASFGAEAMLATTEQNIFNH